MTSWGDYIEPYVKFHFASEGLTFDKEKLESSLAYRLFHRAKIPPWFKEMEIEVPEETGLRAAVYKVDRERLEVFLGGVSNE
jgi:hypothetical protein